MKFLYCCVLLGVAGCKDLTGSPGLPSGTPNPSSYNNPAGALGMRNAAVYRFETAIPQYVIDVGRLTDELEDTQTGASLGVLLSASGVTDPLDERILPEGVSVPDYVNLQQVRGVSSLALGALAAYDTAAKDTAAAKVLRGELYAFQGYAEIMLADLYCSGVPLSTLDFQQDFTYQPSSTTAQVYQAAIAKFDTALTLARASDSVVYLAQMGKGRAYLDLGQYAAAADDVTTVPNGFTYQLSVPWSAGGGYGTCVDVLDCAANVSDHEGLNGLPYRSSGDPRTAALGVAPDSITGDSLYFPVKYSVGLHGSGYAPFPLADWIEARLIQAEAQLQPASAPSGPWLATLNQLRESVGLNDTLDPGTATARVSLLFQERAYWLFLTGHRQGDLRRLLRQYGQYAAFNSQVKVYPTGQYLAPGTGLYGADVTAPIDPTEEANPLFHGCLDRQP